MTGNHKSDPLECQEGLRKINIFLNDEGDVSNISFIVPTLHKIEQVCIGRPVMEMPHMTSRLFASCSKAHHMASTKALDALFDVLPTTAVRKIREMYYMAYFVMEHANRFYALGGAGFMKKSEASPSHLNIQKLLNQAGNELGRQVIACQRRNLRAMRLLAGRGANPKTGIAGGWRRHVTKEVQELFIDVARQNIAFAQFCLKLFADEVLANEKSINLIFSDTFTQPTYYMGMVDGNNRVNFYDGMIRVVAPNGDEFAKFYQYDYQKHIVEAVVLQSGINFLYLKQVGWKGFESGPKSGVYCATPLARLNAADGMATPLAQAEFEKIYEMMGRVRGNGRYQPIHQPLANQWARLIELLYAAEQMETLAKDPEITHSTTRIPIMRRPTEGIGIVAAPRGLLTHHYKANKQGKVTHIELTMGTTNNHAPILMSVKKASQTFIIKGKVQTKGLRNRIEMVFRAYDPCFCHTSRRSQDHSPLKITIHDEKGEFITTLGQ